MAARRRLHGRDTVWSPRSSTIHCTCVLDNIYFYYTEYCDCCMLSPNEITYVHVVVCFLAQPRNLHDE